MVQPNSTPLYAQIADVLMEQIESGALSPGDQLPPERQLSDTFGVTRMTIRQALQVMEMQGLLIRRQGAGTFVRNPKIERHVAHLEPFTIGMTQRGYEPGAQVIHFEARPATSSDSRKLRIPISSLLYYVLRLRFVNQEPMMLEKNTLPMKHFPQLERFDLSKRSLYEVLHTEYGVKITRAYQTLEAVVASDYEASLLNLKHAYPVLLEQRIGFDQNDRPVEAAKDLYRGDRFRFVIQRAELDE